MSDGSFTRSLGGLFAPFPAEAISWRVGSTTKDKSKGMALAYIDARDVMDRLDQVCGPDGWQCEYVSMANGTTCCRIGVLSAGEWIWKSNGGSATGDVDNEKEREMAEKGGYSDAFKRAAVLWGIGRYLYNLDSPWVALEAKGQSYVMAKGEREKLDRAYANYLRRNPPLQPVSVRPDAGQRETPDEHEAGTGRQTKPSAPANNTAPASSPPTGRGQLAAPNDDGQHEERSEPPPYSANVSPTGQPVKDYRHDAGLDEIDHTQDPIWDELLKEADTFTNRGALKAWWSSKAELKQQKPHLTKTFYRNEVARRWDEMAPVPSLDNLGERG